MPRRAARATAVALLTLLGLVADARPAVADGVQVEREVDLAEIVAEADAIVVGRVRGVRPRWSSREAYGEVRRYRLHVDVELAVVEVLKGQVAERRVWVRLDGDPTPGKWEIVPELYRSSYDGRGARRGDRVVAIVGGCCAIDGRRRLRSAVALERAATRDAIKALLAAAPAPPAQP